MELVDSEKINGTWTDLKLDPRRRKASLPSQRSPLICMTTSSEIPLPLSGKCLGHPISAVLVAPSHGSALWMAVKDPEVFTVYRGRSVTSS